MTGGFPTGSRESVAHRASQAPAAPSPGTLRPVQIEGAGHILRSLLLAGVIVLGLTFLLIGQFESEGIAYWPYAALFLSHLAAWMLLRGGLLRAAVFVHASLYIAVILLVLLLYGGLRSPAVFVLSPIVLVVGMTWNGRAAVVAAATCSAGLMGLLAARAVRGELLRGEVTYGIVAIAVLALTSVVLALALSTLGEARERAVAAERERFELRDELHRSKRLETVARLAAGVAHDFNNLLNVIVGQAGRLARFPDAKVSGGALQIEDAAWRAAELTQKLLTVGGRQSFESRELDLNDLVRNVEPLLRQSIPAPERLRFDLAEVALRLRSDSTRLEQILMNLVRNAADATESGGEICVRTGRADPDELSRIPVWSASDISAVRLEVSDTGVGMSPEVQAHLFEPFFTTKGPGRGTGLGLASVYGIVQQGGGAITVESGTGRGTSLKVYFPELAPGYAPSRTIA